MQTLPTVEWGNLTATAVLGWYVWHTSTRTLPALVRAFREEMSAARADFLAEQASLRLELAAERTQRHEDQLLVAEALADVRPRCCGAIPT
jgi:hypothetical protein